MTVKNPNQLYDIIGDVHGYAQTLEILLKRMDYSFENGVWHHPTRKAVFVGDFINRGPHSRKVIQIVRNMVQAGKAYAVLGNHELHAITYFTDDKEGRPLKIPALSTKKMLQTIRDEYDEDEVALEDDIKWLRHLPFFIDFDDFRVVHAAWSPSAIQFLEIDYGKAKLKRSFLKKMLKNGTAENRAVSNLTKGYEFKTPHDMVIKDSKNFQRTSFRIKWWEEMVGKSFRFISYGNKFILPDYSIPNELIPRIELYSRAEKPVFVGHYCVGDKNQIPAPNICCVDHCVSQGLNLSAYRWDGKSELNIKNFVSVQSSEKEIII